MARLFTGLLEQTAVYYWTQTQHRRTAIETIIACVGRVYEEDAATNAGDIVLAAFTEPMRHWLTETILQGAYIREYHIWEKDTKEYFSKQLAWNGNAQAASEWWEGLGGSHVNKVQKKLGELSADIGADTIQQFKNMNKKANIAKHDPGLLVGHFITESEYNEAVLAVVSFWEGLASQEVYRR